jgi:hypothetical protein
MVRESFGSRANGLQGAVFDPHGDEADFLAGQSR